MAVLSGDIKQMTSTQQIPCISIQDLLSLISTPGTLRIIVKQNSGFFVPIVHFDTPHGDTQLHGIIVEDGCALATLELADLVTALEEVLGTHHNIITPDNPVATTLH